MKISYPCNLPFFISQKWNENPSYYNTINMKGHNGWDFALPTGTPIFATHEGVVTFSAIDGTMSETIGISTLDGEYQTLYCHLSERKVNGGDNVKKGQLIALSGNTGRYTTGPHLHFGVRPLKPYLQDNGYNGAIDPAPFFDGTYPNSTLSTVTSTSSPTGVIGEDIFIAMQKAILAFQLSEGIRDYANAPLKNIKIGNKTLQAIKKYL